MSQEQPNISPHGECRELPLAGEAMRDSQAATPAPGRRWRTFGARRRQPMIRYLFHHRVVWIAVALLVIGALLGLAMRPLLAGPSQSNAVTAAWEKARARPAPITLPATSRR